MRQSMKDFFNRVKMDDPVSNLMHCTGCGSDLWPGETINIVCKSNKQGLIILGGRTVSYITNIETVICSPNRGLIVLSSCMDLLKTEQYREHWYRS